MGQVAVRLNGLVEGLVLLLVVFGVHALRTGTSFFAVVLSAHSSVVLTRTHVLLVQAAEVAFLLTQSVELLGPAFRVGLAHGGTSSRNTPVLSPIHRTQFVARLKTHRPFLQRVRPLR